MGNTNKLEAMVAGWYKSAPHLPKEFTKWLADNSWWLALVGVIFGAFGVFTVLSATLLAGAALTAVGGVYGATLGGFALMVVWIYLALAVFTLILTAMAISPLKAHSKRGWSLLFVVAIVNALSLVVNFMSGYNVFGMVWGLLMTAVGLYFLFEIRGYFGGAKPVQPKVKK